jgi:hypothetical protein
MLEVAMPRIAAALLIVAAALVFNATVPDSVYAKDVAAAVKAPVLEDSVPKSTRLMSLLLVLESLRQAPVDLQTSKV